MKNAPVVAYPDDDDVIEYDSDGNPIAPDKSKAIHCIYFSHNHDCFLVFKKGFPFVLALLPMRVSKLTGEWKCNLPCLASRIFIFRKYTKH